MPGRRICRILPRCTNSGDLEIRRAFRAGIWAIEANPQLGFASTVPTRILLAMGTLADVAFYRRTSSIVMPSGSRRFYLAVTWMTYPVYPIFPFWRRFVVPV